MFRLSAQDNGWHFFRDRDDVRRCLDCNSLTDKWSEDFASIPAAPETKHDLSYTYDGVLVVAVRFKEAVQNLGITGMQFRSLQKHLFAARPTAIAPFDGARRKTRFENQCKSCEQYESVVGATPVVLMPEAEVAARGF